MLKSRCYNVIFCSSNNTRSVSIYGFHLYLFRTQLRVRYLTTFTTEISEWRCVSLEKFKLLLCKSTDAIMNSRVHIESLKTVINMAVVCGTCTVRTGWQSRFPFHFNSDSYPRLQWLWRIRYSHTIPHG